MACPEPGKKVKHAALPQRRELRSRWIKAAVAEGGFAQSSECKYDVAVAFSGPGGSPTPVEGKLGAVPPS
eukprot:1727495-Lingulodinium_polyedra.AAC.1